MSNWKNAAASVSENTETETHKVRDGNSSPAPLPVHKFPHRSHIWTNSSSLPSSTNYWLQKGESAQTR